MKDSLNRVCVFCASSSKVNDIYSKAANDLGVSLAGEGIAMNYGGGAVGLMGEISNAMLKNGGEVRGVIPKFMVEVEWEHKGVEDMIHVDTMAERKKLLVEDVDAVISLPGGTGTLEELFEVLSNKKLGLFNKPVILVNTNGFFNPLIDLLNKMIEEDFMRVEHGNLWTVVDDSKDVVEVIKNVEPWTCDAFKIAAV
ncbi:TIGR00730 family Rossman fold protein [Labilibacter sediminis]|nr:TIGR00730 family Rossman fold protein [Labilibacter sediminis]